MIERATYTKAEVREMLGISERTLERRVKAGLIPVIDLGGHVVRFPRAAIDRMCNEGAA